MFISLKYIYPIIFLVFGQTRLGSSVDQTAPGAVVSGSKLFAIPSSSLDALLHDKATMFNFIVITTFSDVRIIRIFAVARKIP